MRWIDLANVPKDFDALMNLIVKEQYLESCPEQLATFLTERKPKELNEPAIFADQYLDAHANSTHNVSRRPIDKDREIGNKRQQRNDRKDDRNARLDTE